MTKDIPPITSSLDIHLYMPTLLNAPIQISMPRSIDMEVVKLTPVPIHVPKELLDKYDELLDYWGNYLKSIPSLPDKYEKCIDKVHKEFVSRGVLLDIARLKGVDWLEPGYAISVEELEAAEAAQGVRVEEGVETARRFDG